MPVGVIAWKSMVHRAGKLLLCIWQHNKTSQICNHWMLAHILASVSEIPWTEEYLILKATMSMHFFANKLAMEYSPSYCMIRQHRESQHTNQASTSIE